MNAETQANELLRRLDALSRQPVMVRAANAESVIRQAVDLIIFLSMSLDRLERDIDGLRKEMRNTAKLPRPGSA